MVYIRIMNIIEHLFCFKSFACQFEVKRRQANPEGLEEREGECAIHIEIILAYPPELHVYPVIVKLVYQLEILD
jgi:hypothetical protein